VSTSTWSRILNEFNAEANIPGPTAHWARVLNRKVQRLIEHTKRPLLIYGSACTSSGKNLSPDQLQVDHSDKIGFHDMLERLDGGGLDVILHSPGGFAEAAETIVEEIRRKFAHVRIIVPAYAKSAATMMAMSADEIVLDEDAELGPIDPQMRTANGIVAAEAIKEQFLKASEEIMKDPKRLSVWVPILQPMGPALLVQCDNAIALSKRLVTEWLSQYMLKGVTDGAKKAAAVAEFLGSHATFKSHGRRIKLEHLSDPKFELKLTNLRSDREFYARVWEVYCTMDVTFANAPISKLFYNSLDDCMVRIGGGQQMIFRQQIPIPSPVAPGPQPPAPQPPIPQVAPAQPAKPGKVVGPKAHRAARRPAGSPKEA